MLRTATVAGTTASAAWDRGPAAEVSVVVATRDRAGFLAELLGALAAQRGAAVEVVIADDGSGDDTWAVLGELAAGTSLPVLALRLGRSHGPSVARNTAVARARGRWLAFTDDDCLPAPDWATRLTAPLAAGAVLVQGCTVPVPGVAHGPWDRAIRVTGRSGLYETCNLAVPAAEFIGCQGFPVLDLLPGGAGRGFGEDAAFGARLVAGGRREVFADGAVVHHRWLPGRYADHLAGLRRLAAFPLLGREAPGLADRYWCGVFLSRHTAAFDAALAGAALAAALRRPWPGLLALPWLASSWPAARARPGRPVGLRLAQLAAADLVGLAALARGSVRARRLLL